MRGMVGPGGHLVAREVREKPPPKWGGVCEALIAALALAALGRNPHRSGEVFASRRHE